MKENDLRMQQFDRIECRDWRHPMVAHYFEEYNIFNKIMSCVKSSTVSLERETHTEGYFRDINAK